MPFVALSLFLLGCGVEMAPAAITATAVAGGQAGELDSTVRGSASDEAARSLSAVPGSAVFAPELTASPLATLAAPTETATPEATEDEAEAEDEALEDAEVEATETPTPIPEPTATALPQVSEGVNAEFAAEFLTLLNAQRTGRGLSAFSHNILLERGAGDFAGSMGIYGFFGHDGPDGSTVESRVRATGYTGAWSGEALSAGQGTPQAALNRLLASPPHAAILLDPTSAEVGIGYAFVEGSPYLHYWVVLTGKP